MKFIFTLLSSFLLTGIIAQTKLEPYGVLPSEHQLKWHEMDMYVLVHFTPTTFENKEVIVNFPLKMPSEYAVTLRIRNS